MDKEMTEDEVLSFWKKNNIYEKAKKKNSKNEGFYMMDGPPYATGHIHMGTALNKVLKDVAMRSQRMQGKDVFDRPGYDTHGLPIEFQVEKEIGSKSKQDIEKYGVVRFIDKCRDYATRYIDVMNDEFANLGVWMNWDDPYKTLDDEYIESIWQVLKTAYEKDLLYLGKYPIHVCPRCATAVAYNEIEYEKQNDNSIYVKFPIKGEKNKFLIIWTTTPWTLPANTGIMVHPEIEYSEIQIPNGERWIIAKELVEKRMKEFGLSYKLVREFKGKQLEGTKYENPLSKHTKIKIKNGSYVVLAPRYVTIEDGTGLVHCAPGHGKEDYDIGMENKLDIISPVEIDGTLNAEAGKYAGQKARVVDKEIIEDLKKDGFLVHQSVYNHDYPRCWRCKTPLLMMSRPQWFLRISKIHKKILDENDKVNWDPKWAHSRMKAWLEGLSDWPISRERYWGTPLPIWQCSKCNEMKVVGSISELEKLSGKKKIGMHKPEIDEIIFKCKCGSVMKRVSSVFDVWFDSGATSWAALAGDKKMLDKFWPADLNIEGTDQFRGWWNSQMILSVIGFNRRPYENIMVHGLILDVNKKKMSKSMGNAVSPPDVIKKYSRDYLRYYLIKLSRGEDFSYNEREFSEIQKVFTILANVNTFVSQTSGKSKLEAEDKWILSKFANLVKEVKENYNKFRFYSVIDNIEKFLVADLSRTYIQMIRERSNEVGDVLNLIRIGLVKMLAPIVPFMAERMWQSWKEEKIVKEESVHLSEFTEEKKKEINEKLEDEFKIALEIIEKSLAERDKLKIGLKWPLADATYYASKPISKGVEEIIAKQINVKKLFRKEINKNTDLKVEFNTKITPELEAEGFAREIARRVQAERKNRGLQKQDSIQLELFLSVKLNKLLAKQKEFIKSKTGAKKLEFSDDKNAKVTFTVRDENIGISF